jgi:tetratricopeptide (TPR) repeat protein
MTQIRPSCVTALARGSLRAVLVSAALVATGAAAQIQPIPEGQLRDGFLGDQNSRLISQDAPSGSDYVARALAAIEQKDYTRALGILRPYRRSRELAYYFLAGRAHTGLGNFAEARQNLTEAIRREQSFIGAHFALGLLEAEHGDRAAATKVLDDLKAKQTKCADKCRDAADLGAAIGTIEAALRKRLD